MTARTAISSRSTDKAIYDHIIPARSPWSGIIRKGQGLRTLAAQGSAYIGPGTPVRSNRGRTMLTMVADTVGEHDTSAGACSCEANTVRFGHHTRYMHACRENFIVELAKYGMTKHDIVSNINFFMNVPVLPDGALAIIDGASKPGDYVELTAEMDVLCVISNCPQVNNPCNGFNPTPVRVLIWNA